MHTYTHQHIYANTRARTHVSTPLIHVVNCMMLFGYTEFVPSTIYRTFLYNTNTMYVIRVYIYNIVVIYVIHVYKHMLRVSATMKTYMYIYIQNNCHSRCKELCYNLCIQILQQRLYISTLFIEVHWDVCT